MGGRESLISGPSKRGGRRPEIGPGQRSLTLVLISALVAAGAGFVGVPAPSRAGGSESPQGAPAATAYRLTAASGSGAPSRPAPSAQSVPVGTVPPAADEVPGLRTRTSDTYLVDGEYEALVYGGSVNYPDSRGTWQPIDDTLVPSTAAGYAWQNQANRYTLLLPSTLSGGPIAFRSPTGTISLQLAGARGTASVSGASITYASALPGINVTLTAEQDAVKESLVLTGASSATALVYSLGLSSGLRASATAAGGVAITDSTAKKLLFSFDPPIMSDAAGAQAPASAAILRLGTTATGTTVTVALDNTWLQSSARQWPVTIDPSINYDSDQDCQIQSGTKADTNLCGSGQYLYTGYGGQGSNVRRSVLLFNVQDAIPAGAEVTHAGLAVNLEWTTTSNYGSVSMYQLTQGWTTGVTWNDYDGTNAWTAPGGTYATSDLASQTPTSAGWYYWAGSGPSQLAQEWLSGTQANDGVLLRADNESNDEVDIYGSTQTGSDPYYFVTYVNALGDRPTYGTDGHQLSDRSGLAVNVANGNLVLTGNDLQITGTGLNLDVQRIYNSLGEGGAFGTWLMGSGADEQLTFEDGNVDFQGPGGFDLTFYADGAGGYTPPPGLDASLVKNQDGSYTLTYDSSAERLSFTSAGTLTSDSDRNGDTLTYTTSEGNLSSITDTQGRQISFSYGSSVGANLITKVTDSTSRTWQYGYTSANGYAELTSYTDPAGKQTQYSYDTSGRVTEITDSLGHETTFAYDADSRVTSITYVTNIQNGTGPTTTYAYHPNSTGVCAAAPTGDVLGGYTVETDANNHSTADCYDLQGLILQTIDPDSASAATSYTPDQHEATAIDALWQTTAATYNSNNDLTQVTAPANGPGQNGASGSATYNTPSTVNGYQYLPSSATDPEGNCTAYVYDTAGNVTDTYAGQATGCDGKTGGIHTATRYQGDLGVSCGGKTGETCEVISGDGGATTYGYDSEGNLTSVTPPSPLGGETITYDSLSRVASATDGKGQKTSYTYDNLDRVTQILYGGATQCTPSTGNCITYTYDADGNRTGMTDQSGTTSYYYNALNQLTTESLPDTSSACSGSSPAGITYAYDGVGNLLTYCDSGGTTTYAYDPDNRLLSLAQPGGTCGSPPSLCTTFSYNADGERTQTTFPGGATQTTTYDNSQDITSVVGKSSTASVLTSFTYTYTNGANDTPLVQTRTESDAVASNTYTYSYDALNRLAAASVSSGTGTSYSYSYDSDGNLLTKTAGSASTTYAYNAADQLCWAYSGTSTNGCSSAPIGATTYSFDLDGNLTESSTGASFSYNAKNQTTSITYGGAALSNLAYTDQGQQNRISAGSTTFDNNMAGTAISTTSGTSTYYLRDDQGNVLGERLGSSYYYYLTDAEGSVVAVISGDGQTVSDRYGYDPYGATTYTSGSVANPFGYAGGFTDPTGLIHFGARYYDPATTRWTQRDAAANGQASPYSYSDSDPPNGTDPTGDYCCRGHSSSRWGWGWITTEIHIWILATQGEAVQDSSTFSLIAAGLMGIGAIAGLVGIFLWPFLAVAGVLGALSAEAWAISAIIGRNTWDSRGEWYDFYFIYGGPWFHPLSVLELDWFWTNPNTYR
jgi:RHS repeat-associated protein